MSTRLDNPLILKCGLGQSQGRQVVDALLKVQQKLNRLESKQANCSHRGDVDDKVRNDSGRASSSLVADENPNQQLSLESLDTRLKLIESKLDLVTQLLVGNINDLQTRDSAKQVQDRARFKIHDENVKKNLMMQQVQDSLYTLNEEYAYLNE